MMICDKWQGAALIGLDWGTTSLRAYLFDADGAVLDSRFSTSGIMRLSKPPAAGGCDAELERICGDWLNAVDLPIIAAGMVGSAQGWVKAPYVPTPASCEPLAKGLARVQSARGSIVHVVPGIIENGQLPNVMRGEETQIFGALKAYPRLAQSDKVLIGLPGTHAKWAFVNDGKVERFLTFMTGEVFGVLRDYTILGKTMHPGGEDNDASFLRGVDAAVTHGHVGVLSTIFSTRTLALTEALKPEEQSDYLSGLLIGHELIGLDQALSAVQGRLADWTLGLVGDAALCRRYEVALRRVAGVETPVLQQTTEQGLFYIAQQAGLVRSPINSH
jgi:2-dehydro-3-deoxygalactonokinase